MEDDGCGLSEEELTDLRIRMDEYGCKAGQSQGNIGLGNVHRRLKIYYGTDYGVTVTSAEGVGTTVCVRVPINPGIVRKIQNIVMKLKKIYLFY